LEYFEKCLAIELKTLGEDRPSVARSYTNIGSIWESKDNFDKALEYYEKSLLIKLKALGKEHPSVAISYNNIGGIWENKGNFDKALEYYDKTLAIELKTLGGEHPSVTTSYYNLGLCYIELKNYLLAIESFKKGFINSKKGGFPFHIAKCYEKLDEKAIALDYFIQSAEIRMTDPDAGPEDENTKESIQNAKRVAKELGEEDLLSDWI
jgi:tetratricopeptide (TPR) repeat protein